MSSITKANAAFPDQQQTEEYLKTLSPRTARKFWKFVSSDELRKYPSFKRSPFKEMDIDGIGVLTARVFVLAQKWHKGSLQASEFRSKIRYLSGAGSIEIFEKLSTSVQEELWTEEYGSHSYMHCVGRAYLDLLHRTSFHPGFCYYHYTESYEIKIGIRSKAVEKMVNLGSTLDLSDPSSDYVESLKTLFSFEGGNLNQAYWNSKCLFDFGPQASTYVTLLRALYGEKKVLHALEWTHSAGVKVCLEEVVAILDSWEEFSQYPAEWVANAQGFEHHTPAQWNFMSEGN